MVEVLINRCGSASVLWAMTLSAALGATTRTIGPLPYLSQADSPFDLANLGSTFFLEDFEDGAANTPGLRFIELPPYIPPPVVKSPSVDTDSVDGDDGVIDGAGSDGHSLLGQFQFCDFSGTCHYRIQFEFDVDELGFLPNVFAFAWTDGVQRSAAGLISYNAAGQPQADGFHERFGDSSFEGTTAEDRLLGIFRRDGIQSIDIVSISLAGSGPFEIDHVQYGLIVPETPSISLLASGVLTLAAASAALRKGPGASDGAVF